MDPAPPPNGGPVSPSPLQFDKAEFAQAEQGRSCSRCHQVMGTEYFAAGTAVVCPVCARALSGEGQSKQALMKAAAYGGGAALIGTAVWLAILKIFDMELGLVAIAVGVLVGIAVKKGSGGSGGWKYQAMAMALTYVSITASYVPFVLKGLAEAADKQDAEKAVFNAAFSKPDPAANPGLKLELQPQFKPLEMSAVQPAPAAATKPGVKDLLLLVAIVFGIAFAAPFLNGVSNIMGILIIGIALYEAWKLNKRVPVTGPFKFASQPEAATSPTPPSPPGSLAP